MGARGRKSRAELTLVQRAEEVLVVRRPEPPEVLSDEAAAEWREVVNSLPADHFSRAVHSMLEGYCTAAAEVRRIDQLIQDLRESDQGSLGAYDKLLAMHDRQMRLVSMLAVRLGIGSATNVTRVRSLAGGRDVGSKPWEKLSR